MLSITSMALNQGWSNKRDRVTRKNEILLRLQTLHWHWLCMDFFSNLNFFVDLGGLGLKALSASLVDLGHKICFEKSLF